MGLDDTEAHLFFEDEKRALRARLSTGPLGSGPAAQRARLASMDLRGSKPRRAARSEAVTALVLRGRLRGEPDPGVTEGHEHGRSRVGCTTRSRTPPPPKGCLSRPRSGQPSPRKTSARGPRSWGPRTLWLCALAMVVAVAVGLVARALVALNRSSFHEPRLLRAALVVARGTSGPVLGRRARSDPPGARALRRGRSQHPAPRAGGNVTSGANPRRGDASLPEGHPSRAPEDQKVPGD